MGGHTEARPKRAAAWWTFVLGLASLMSVLPIQGALPPKADVVLLAGLPGDLESESLYRDQLQSWLDLCALSEQAQRLFVLCDAPDTLKPLAKLQTQVFKADRTNFLALGPALAGSTNELLVIALGHGGRQGITPVFHVRGPRITAADFQTLAGKAGAPTSHWVLLFRGSGAFASALAAEHRVVLSSERDTMFTSDPIGMSLLLKVAREQPALSFNRLSEQLGQATAAWYRDRNLARTEEPTLWEGTRSPRLLAAGAEAEAAGSLASVTPPQHETPTNQARPSPPTEMTAKDLPAAWQEIKRVEPTKYPDADGVVLRRQMSYTLGSNPAIQTEEDEFIQVLTAEGKRLGDIDVSFSPPFEDLTFVDCEVLLPNGKLLRLDPDAIREVRANELGDYQREQRKFFSLPGVVPGAVLRVHRRSQWKSFPLPHISLQLPLSQELPITAASVQVSVPSGTPFHFALDGLAATDPAIKQSSYGTTYAWQFHNLAAQSRDVLTSPRQHPRLLLSTFPDWQTFAGWYGRISKLTDEVTPDIQAKAAELTRQATNDREKVLALYDFVTRLRYVAVPLGVNSFRPHAAANVLQNQYGDCKDKANLFNALLHAVNLDAHLVLVPRFGQAHEAIPGLAFNHAISRVKLGDEILWVDTTDDVCRFGLLPPGDPGRKVLVIDGQTDTLTQLPAPNPDDHLLRLHGTIDCSRGAEAAAASFKATARGYPDYVLRETAREAKEHGASLPLLGARLQLAAGVFGLDHQSATAVSALQEDFTWQAAGACIGLATAAGEHRFLRAPFWLPKEWDLALHRRQAPLFLNQGYPLRLEEELAFTLPENASVAALPAVQENTEAPLRWRVEWKSAGSNKFTAQFRAELTHGELAAEETAPFQKQLRRLRAALGAGVLLPAASLGAAIGP